MVCQCSLLWRGIIPMDGRAQYANQCSKTCLVKIGSNRGSFENFSVRFRLPNPWPPWVVAGAYLKALLACSSTPYIIINAIILTSCSNLVSLVISTYPQLWASCGMVATSALVRPGLNQKPLGNAMLSKMLQFPCNFTSTMLSFWPRPFSTHLRQKICLFPTYMVLQNGDLF